MPSFFSLVRLRSITFHSKQPLSVIRRWFILWNKPWAFGATELSTIDVNIAKTFCLSGYRWWSLRSVSRHLYYPIIFLWSARLCFIVYFVWEVLFCVYKTNWGRGYFKERCTSLFLLLMSMKLSFTKTEVLEYLPCFALEWYFWYA